ncbi:MAG: Methyltransferase type 11 [Parcubacteria group bacterium GW2011_GWA2_36_24]|nr:MAG: Methyltransferase type 11 [Parcubacteria group bacterium GW2011_GWA2_36_24]
MDYQTHKDYYKTAYQNGIDIWTHLPVKIRGAKSLVGKLPPGGTILDLGSGRKLKFIEADVFNIPFTDESFDGICDFGLLENLHKEDWETYVNEINRVLRSGGFYLNVSLSRKTRNFLDFSPINSKDGEFEEDNVHYHFFEKEEMKNIFNNKMTLISDNVEFVEKPREIALLQTLFKKN